MAIQVWDGTKYVGAELGRFGESGTLKEALVWDGTKYVKVWPSSPYPLSGEYGPTPYGGGNYVGVGQHTIEEAGSYTLTNTGTSTGNYFSVAINGPWGNTTGNLANNPGNVSTATTTQNLSLGDQITFQVTGFSAGQTTGTWSITKN